MHAQPPFPKSTVTYKVVVYAPTERADTFPPISTLPLYTSFIHVIYFGTIITQSHNSSFFITGWKYQEAVVKVGVHALTLEADEYI